MARRSSPGAVTTRPNSGTPPPATDGSALEHQAAVWSVAFSPDGRSILTGSQDGMARLWDGDVGQAVGRPLEHGRRMADVEFSRDGKNLLAAALDGQVWLWDVASGQLLGQPVELDSQILAMAWSQDGKTIVTGSLDKTARLWDAATGRPLGKLLGMRTRSMPWRSVRMARRSSPGARTRRRGCGTPPPAGLSANPWNIRRA